MKKTVDQTYGLTRLYKKRSVRMPVACTREIADETATCGWRSYRMVAVTCNITDQPNLGVLNDTVARTRSLPDCPRCGGTVVFLRKR